VKNLKFLVLGGGSCQLNLIKYLKEKNHTVIVTDYYEDALGKKYSDFSELVSTFDLEGIVKIAQKYKVDTIITAGTDQPVYYASKACEILNLPNYISSDKALNVTNKKRMKKIFNDYNIPSVKYKLLNEDYNLNNIENSYFPGVVKPLDSQGQRGVFRVENRDDLDSKMKISFNFTKKKEILFESYYKHDEITVSGWVIKGETKIFSISDRVTYNNFPHIGICIAHNYPSKHYEEYGEEIIRITNKIVKAFKVDKGPIYFQMLIGDDGIKVNEIACRIGGAFEDVYIPFASDIDILDLLIKDSLGYSINNNIKDNSINEKLKLSVQLFFANPGCIEYLSPIEDLLEEGCIIDGRYNFKVGEKIQKIENATQRAGHFITYDLNPDNLQQKINYIFKKIKILNENGENLVIPYNSYFYK